LNIPEAYEALLLDAFKGDHSNFVRDDELDASWRIFTPLLHYLDDHPEMSSPPNNQPQTLCFPGMFGTDADGRKPDPYKYGSRGPAVLNEFMKSYGFIRGKPGYGRS
jgi:glucose-6-phosphate 1-dehydrogenase